jgi:NDP-sugar pyrophosphorylase family protein
MLLCAGYGTRLGAVSDECPKPMLPVCDVPIIRYGIAQLVAHGIRDIVVNLHHRGDVIESDLGDGSALGARIQYSREAEILGTGGGLKHGLALLDPNGDDQAFVSMNGKLIFDVDFTALLAHHRDQPGAIGTMVVQRVPDAAQWGAVDVDGEPSRLRVRNILGAGHHMFCGVHVTRPSVVARLPDGEACMVRQGYLPWIASGATVAAFEHGAGYFAEHSTPARYLASNWALLDGVVLRNPPPSLSGVDPAASVAASATILPPIRIGPGAHIGQHATVGPYAVVGSGARIADGARVSRTVVWKGARVHGEVHDAIVTPGGVVPVASD